MSESLIGFETYRNRSDIALIRAFPESARLRTGFLAHLASQAGYLTTLTLVNFSNDSQVLRITADGLQVGGSPRTPSSVTVERTLAPNARLEERVDQMFTLSGEALIDGYIRFETQTDTSGVIAFLDYGTTDGIVLSAVEAQGEGYSNLFFSQVAEGAGYYTGLALLNPNSEPSIVTLDTFDAGGVRTGSTIVNLESGERKARLLSEFLQRQVDQLGGYIRLTATRPIFAFELFGSRDSLTFLASVPAQGESLKPQASGRMVDASQGANVISSDGSTSLLIPPKALNSNAPIKVAPISVADLPLPTPDQQPIAAVEATPAGTQFEIPVRLTFPVNADLDPGTKIPLLIFDPQSRTYQPTEFVATVDKSGRTASAVVMGTPSVDVQVAGTAFVANSVVQYDTNPMATRFIDKTLLVVTLLSSQLNPAIHQVDVFNPSPGGGTSNIVNFTVTGPVTNQAPVLNAGPNQTITLPASANLNGTVTDDGLPTGST